MTEGRKHLIRRHYEHRITPHRKSYEVLDWASEASQQARFAVLASHMPLEGKSLLDVGCGLGDLLVYLRERHMDVHYTGVDILEKMVLAAKERLPDANFVHADIFASLDSATSPSAGAAQAADNISPFPPKSFDVVFCSGAFNLNLGNNEEFVPRAASTLMSLARECMVFNLLHKRAASQERTYFYCSPEKVRSLLQPFSWNIEILDDYLHNDFTVICRRA